MQDRLLRPARSCHLDHPLGPALNADSLDALMPCEKPSSTPYFEGAGEGWRADAGASSAATGEPSALAAEPACGPVAEP